MSTSAVALGLKRRSALPVRREVLDRMTAQRLDRKRLLRASISAVKLRQGERVSQAVSCLGHVGWRQDRILGPLKSMHLRQSSFQVMGNYQRSFADGQEECRGDVPMSQMSCAMILQLTETRPLPQTDCTHALHSFHSLCIQWLRNQSVHMFQVL